MADRRLIVPDQRPPVRRDNAPLNGICNHALVPSICAEHVAPIAEDTEVSELITRPHPCVTMVDVRLRGVLRRAVMDGNAAMRAMQAIAVQNDTPHS